MASLTNKVAIVTGASAGAGRAYALALAGAGATVIASARSLGDPARSDPQQGTLTEVIDRSHSLTGRIYAARCDVEMETDVSRMITETAVSFGRIDILVNNAGIFPHLDSLSMNVEDWDRTMAVNVRGPYLTARAAAPIMIRQRRGSIVNITSGSANPTRAANLVTKVSWRMPSAKLR